MSQLKILDSGYVSHSERLSQVQIVDSKRAGYTGSAVTSFLLNNTSCPLSGSVNTESKSIINSNVDPSTTLTSVNRRSYKISFLLKKEVITSGFDVNNVVQLSRLDRTDGLKILYRSTGVDPLLPTIVEAMGAVNTGGFFSEGSPTDDNGTVSLSAPYLVGRVKNFAVGDNSDGDFWRVSFDFEVSG